MGVMIPVRRIVWKPCWRIIPSRYPSIHPFERVADPDDFELLCEIESITNDRLHEEDRVSGPGSLYIMAAMTHLNPQGSRFSDGTWGVYYAAREFDTAIAETRYHRTLFMLATREKPMNLEMRVLTADLKGNLHDIREPGVVSKEVYSPQRYGASQKIAQRLRSRNSPGIVYHSVRKEKGQCVAVFQPTVLSHCRIVKHLIYRWDGAVIRDVYEIREIRADA